MERKKSSVKANDRVLVGILAILFGCFGVHKFMMGYIKEGIIIAAVNIFGAVLFCIGPVVASIVAIVEGIIYLTKTDEEFGKTYIDGDKPWF